MPLIPISREAHAKTRVRPLRSFAFAERNNAVPLYGSEIVPLSHELPVVFIAEGENFTPAALLGLRPNENVLIDEQGRWLGTNIPNLWKRGPFRLAHVQGAQDGQMVLCLDDESDLISETEGQPLFDETGAAAALVSAAGSLLSQLENDSRIVRKISSTLSRLGLLVPWNLEIAQPDGSTLRMADVYQVDEARIAGLSADDLVALRDMGALTLIYAHLLSLAKVSTLVRLTKAAIEREQKRESMQRGNLNLDSAFGIVEDDPFIF